MARGLARAGIEVTVVTTNAKQIGIVDVKKVRIEEDVKIITAPVCGGGVSRFANRQGISPEMWKNTVIEASNTDIVHIDGFLGPSPIVSALASLYYKKPYLVSTRGTLEIRSLEEKAWKKKAALALGARRMLEKASALHYTTAMEKSLSPSWVREIDSFVIPNPVEIPERADSGGIRERFGIDARTLLIGTFGRLHPRKGFGVLLPAIAKAAAHQDLKLLAVGPDEAGYGKELEQVLESEKLVDRVIFAEELSGNELASAYAAVDMLVLPSLGESFGNVVVESAAQGTPCLISDQVGLKDWVEENNVGRVLPLDVNAWADALTEIQKEEIPSRWDPFRLARLVKESFSIEAVAKQMMEQYEKILSCSKKEGKG